MVLSIKGWLIGGLLIVRMLILCFLVKRLRSCCFLRLSSSMVRLLA